MQNFPEQKTKDLSKAYDCASEYYAAYGVDSDKAIEYALTVPVSVHCWQADDVQGFERQSSSEDGGIMATGNYPGRARNGAELRQDLDKALELLPGQHRINVHAFYCEQEQSAVDRDSLAPEHFSQWVSWAVEKNIALDFNTSFFAHPRAADGFTLSHPDKAIRDFWIRHAVACRFIAEDFGKKTGYPCILNHWTPDGSKDVPADRWSPRERLAQSMDTIMSESKGVDPGLCKDAIESKLFGIGSESYVVGSAEFCNHYALTRNIMYCLDMGHFHPTETIDDKISALLQFHPEILIHVSRPVRWDSDHVVLFNDELRNVFLEIARGAAWDRIRIALDFFDASINRIAAYIIGARAARMAILYSLLDPGAALKESEAENRCARRLALLEQMRVMPFQAVWDTLCERSDVPRGLAWMNEIEKYEQEVLSGRQ